MTWKTDAESGTPGPWRACHNGNCTCGMVWSKPADIPVAVANKDMSDGPDMVYATWPKSVQEANARRIARVPALEEVARAAEELESAIRNYVISEEAWDDSEVDGVDASMNVIEQWEAVSIARDALREALSKLDA